MLRSVALTYLARLAHPLPLHIYVFKSIVKGHVNFEKVKLQSNVTTSRANRRKNGETEMGYRQKWNFTTTATLLLLHATDLTAV